MSSSLRNALYANAEPAEHCFVCARQGGRGEPVLDIFYETLAE